MAQPVISYPGAKWRFYEHIKPYIPKDIKDWREPFFGGGSMSLSIADDPDFQLETMTCGDLAPEIWAMWQGIRDNPDEVVEVAKSWWETRCKHQIELQKEDLNIIKPYIKIENPDEIKFSEEVTENDRAVIKELLGLYWEAIKEGKEFWDWAESVDCSTLSLSERAARTFLVNRVSFSGMGDSGSLSKDQFCDFRYDKFDRIFAASPLLKRMTIRNVSFEETVKDVGKDSFVFFDPPYYQQESSGLYGRNGDTHKGFQHEHFAEVTKGLNCRWFVTYDDSVKVRKMFKGRTANGEKIYQLPFVIPGGYTMAGKTAEDALAGEELFIANYDIKNMGKTEDLGL